MSGAGDSGLQAERTALARRRTLLAVAAAVLVAVRLLAPVLGGASVAAGAAGLVAVAGIGVVLHRGRTSGAALLALATLTAAGAALGLLLLALP